MKKTTYCILSLLKYQRSVTHKDVKHKKNIFFVTINSSIDFSKNTESEAMEKGE